MKLLAQTIYQLGLHVGLSDLTVEESHEVSAYGRNSSNVVKSRLTFFTSTSSPMPSRGSKRRLAQTKEPRKKARKSEQGRHMDELPTPSASLEPLQVFNFDPHKIDHDSNDVSASQQAQNEAVSLEDVDFDEFLLDLQDDPAPGSQSCQSASQDSGFDLGKAEEQEMMNLLENHVDEPPSSIVRALDNSSRNSRSADEFDPSLRHSPATEASTATIASSSGLLRSDIDWSLIQTYQAQLRRDGVSFQSSPACGSSGKLDTKSSSSEKVLSWDLRSKSTKLPTNHIGGDIQMRPFKTFFEVRKMLHTKSHMFRNSKAVVFELFARVVHSAREALVHKQHFQLRDLFEDKPPYISGTLPA